MSGPKAEAEQHLAKNGISWDYHKGAHVGRVAGAPWLFVKAPKGDQVFERMLYAFDLRDGRSYHRQGDSGCKLRGRPMEQLVHNTWLRRYLTEFPEASIVLARVAGAAPSSDEGASRMALLNVNKRKRVITEEESSLEITDHVLHKMLADYGVDLPREVEMVALDRDGNEVEVFAPFRLVWRNRREEPAE